MTPRRLLAFDSCCGLAAGLVYFLLFDFLIQTLKLPEWLAQIQMTANLAYGVFGAALLASRQLGLLRLLMAMNFAYAGFCIAMSGVLFSEGIHAGAALLLVEGIVVGGLAAVESKVWSEKPPTPVH